MTMRVRGLLLGLLCFVGLWSWAAAATAGLPRDGVSSSGSGSLSSIAPQLLTADPFASEPLDGLGEAARLVEEARRASPEAVAAREASLTEFENLNASQVTRVAGESFPAAIIQPAGGPPQLPAGESIVGFPSTNAAQVDLGAGKRGVIDSMQPIAVESSPGQRVPVNLQLQEVGGAFEPSTPVSSVRIPKRLSGGISFPDRGVTVTPVDSSGAPLSDSEGSVDGASVLYPNTQTDADTVVKPVTYGFDLATVLRSPNSPSELHFRLDVPAGASIVQASGVPGAINITNDGDVLATVHPPTAVDAAGAQVPVSMKLSGSTLVVSLDLPAGEYQYPLYVDPTVTDTSRSYQPGVWLYLTDDTANFSGGWGELSMGGKTWAGLDDNAHPEAVTNEPYVSGDWGFFSYTTQGASRIYSFVSTVYETAQVAGSIADQFQLRTGAGIVESGAGEGGKAEAKFEEVGEHEHVNITICREVSCGPVAVSGSEQNAAYYEAKARFESKGLFSSILTSAAVSINQESPPTASFDTSTPTLEGLPNALLTGKWYKGNAAAEFGLDARDPGIGVAKQGLSSPNKAGWGYTLQNETRNECQGVQCNQCFEPPCKGIASGTGQPLTYSLAAAAGGELPEGEDTIQGKVEDNVGLSVTASAKVKIDSAPPKSLTLSGLPSNHEISDGEHFLIKASATDGVTGTPSSGIASILLELDGKPLTGAQGSCTPGPCTGSGEWTLNGESFAAGQHALTLLATDNAGNVASEEYVIKIHHPQSVPVGPGSLNPVTGEMSLTASDVEINVPDGALTVLRGYRSRHLTQGTEGPLGPQWSLSLQAQASLSRVPNGMVLTGSSGAQQAFVSSGTGTFTSPTGDASATLLEKLVAGQPVFTLTENGSVTTFELPSGSSGSVWTPSSSEGPNGTSQTIYKFRLAGGVIEPTEELAPVSAGVVCGKEVSELKAGCRALKFEYATEKTAKGEKASEWGSVTGHLSQVIYVAWDPTTKAKTERVVAEYAYDASGRLRAEWNPTITPELKTVYGYDTEGHVSAVSAPGLEPALLEQGTTPSDAGTGRLLAVSVPSAATGLGAGEAPANTEAPVLSSTKPAVGTKISATTEGKWTGTPLAFSYQWDDCNASGKECTPIPGAVNQAYYPVPADEGRTLTVQVVALNSTGATATSSAATSAVTGGTPNTPLPEPPAVGGNSVTTVEYQVPVSGTSAPYQMGSGEVAKWGQTDVPHEATAIFPPDKVMGWPAKKYERETVLYMDGKDRSVNTAIPTGGISTTEYNSYNDVTRTLTADDRQTALNEGTKSAEASHLLDTESTYEESGSEPGTTLLSTLGPIHKVQIPGGTQVEGRTHTVYSYNEGAPAEGGPYHSVTKMTEGAWVSGKEEPASVRTTKTEYNWKLRKPTVVTVDPGGLNLKTTTKYEETTGAITEMSKPASKSTSSGYTYSSQFGSLGSGKGQLNNPKQIAIDSKGNTWVADEENNRVDVFSATGAFVKAIGWGVTDGGEKLEVCNAEAVKCQAGLPGAGAGQFKGPKGLAISGTNVWVADSANNRVEEITEEGAFVRSVGTAGTGKLQFNSPRGLAIDSLGNVLVADTLNHRVEKLSETGVFVSVLGWGVLDGKSQLETCAAAAPSCQIGIKGSGNGEFNEPKAELVDAHNNLVVSDGSNNRLQVFNEKNEFVKIIGSYGSGQGQFISPKEIKRDSHGNLFVADEGNSRIEEFTEGGEFIQTFGWGVKDESAEYELCTKEAATCKTGTKGAGAGEFHNPWGLAIDTEGNLRVSDEANHRIETFKPPTTVGNPEAHITKTAYYTAKTESPITACQSRPEYANLPCERYPAAQPGAGLPELPVTQTTYNIWDEPEITTETVGTTTRKETESYDAAGRLKTQAIASTVGTALPTVTSEYSKTTGALEKQCQNEGKPCTEGKPKTITSTYNKLGELEAYTDADGNTTTYEYDVAGRTHKTNDGKGTQTRTYSGTTGMLTELVDSSAEGMKFTAGYDAEGNMLTETYPNGMTATFTYDATGKAVSLVYKKLTNCTEEEKEKCKWLKDSIVPSAQGQWMSQTSTLSKEAYSYDQSGRLLQVQNTPTGKGCTTHSYAYDEDTNRTSLTTFGPNAKNECATESGTIEAHTYDTADRLIDSGVVYNTFGDITTLPAADAAKVPLTSTYYTNNQLASQTQGEQTIGYNLDPAGRTRETVATGPKLSDIVSHYAGPNNTPVWTVNTSGEWSRNITGISGTLVAIQSNAETPILQLENLHGDIVATALKSETATELATKADTSEFGVPGVSAPAKYSWLGAIQLPTEELPAATVTMGIRTYVPEIGRFLQPDPITAGSTNAYGYTHGDPLTSSDPSGAYDNIASAALQAIANEQGREVAARRRVEVRREEQAAAEQLAAELAAQAAAQAAANAAAAAGPQYAEEWEEWEEEEGGWYEWAAYEHGSNTETVEGRLQSATLIQPLVAEVSRDEGATGGERTSVSAGPPRSAFGTHSHYYHVAKSGFHPPSTWEQFMCAIAPDFRQIVNQSDLGKAIADERRSSCSK